MRTLTLIQGSLHPDSRTAVVIDALAEQLTKQARLSKQEVRVRVVDLRTLMLEFCDGRPIEEYNEDLQELFAQLQDSAAIVLGTPIYGYAMSGVVKNVYDILSRAFDNALVGIVANAGSARAQLATSTLVHTLTYESRAQVAQPIVFTAKDDFSEDRKIANERVTKKVADLAEVLLSATL